MSIDYSRGHFEPPAEASERRKLFANSVSTIVLELTEHCNRRCSYCPVSIVERNKNRVLPNESLDRILSDLQTIDYSQSFCLNLYNEPTSDKATLLSSIEKIRKKLPKSQIYFSSNGDYLDLEYIDELFTSGLSRLTITLHTPPAAKYNDVDAISRFTAFAAKLGTRIDVERFGADAHIFGKLKYRSFDITIFTLNFIKDGVNRAGAMTDVEVRERRSAPCSRPFENITISFDGRLFPCCQFYPDLPENDRYSVGRLDGFESIFDAYCSKSMSEWRKSLFRYGPKQSPCDTCLESNHKASPDAIRERDALAVTLGVATPEEIAPAEANSPVSFEASRRPWWSRKSKSPVSVEPD